MVVAERPATETRQLKGFDTFVQRVMRDWKVNGLAMAIAREGEIIYSRGFGLRDAQEGLDVTTHTLFPLASITKTFTTMSLALLVDEGKLDWDTPVRHYLPTFKLWDQFASERMTPRDLVSHRSGLPRHDLLWYRSSRTRQELFDALQYLEPTSDFRTIWQYQNLMYMTAGYLVGQIAGTSWEDFVRTRIFEPLGMVSSIFDVRTMQRTSDFSRGYKKDKGRTVVMPFYEEQEALGPAGAIVSNVDDMSRWLLLHLNRGMHNGERFISEAQIREMHSPQMVVSRGKHPEMPHNSYGLGWFVQPYRGHNMVHHGGNIDGFSTLLTLMPEDNVGVIILTNMNATPLRDLIPYNIFDRFIDGRQVGWNARFKADWKEMEEAEKRGKEKRKTTRTRGTRPSHRLEAYAGTYRHPGYGDLRVDLDGEKLRATYNGLDLELKHYHYDTFEATYKEQDMTFPATFSTDERGDVSGVAAPLEPTVKNIIFSRVRGEEMRDRSFLEQFVGTYELLGNVAAVEFKGDVLQISVPGLPDYELDPVRGTQFAFKGLTGFDIEFQRDDTGAVTGAVVTIAGSVYDLTRRS